MEGLATQEETKALTINERKGFPLEKLCRGRTSSKRSLPDGNGWKACSGLIMAGKYIGLSPKRKFGEQPREALPVD